MKENKKANSFSAMKTCIIFLIVISAIFITARYVADENFRTYFDTHILKKELTNENLGIIELDSDSNPNVYAYSKYITVLSKNKLTEYTSDGKVFKTFDVNISVPLVESNNKYMVLAEKDGQKLYLISDANILWQKDVEGNISKVNVNANGFVSIVVTNTMYKSVIIVFDSNGTELFRKYVSKNYTICTDISSNNKNLAIGEVDYSGTVVKSIVEIISVPLAQSDPDHSILYTYESENNEIITAIKYQDKENVIGMFNTYIQKVSTNSDERLYDITENDLFTDIHLTDGIAIINKQSSGLFSYEYQMVIKSPNSKAENLYILNSDVPKKMLVSGSIIGLNFGNEIQFINSSGWLVKKYVSNKEITNVVLGDSIAGIVYKDKIEIINL